MELTDQQKGTRSKQDIHGLKELKQNIEYAVAIKWTNAKNINSNHADFAFHAKSIQIQILEKVRKCVQNRLLLKFGKMTHQRSKECPELWRRRRQR